MDETFERQPVYTKLTWEWSWHGIRVTTPLIGAAPGLMLFPLAAAMECMTACIALSSAGALFFCVLQFKRDENALAGMARRYRVPRHLVPVAPRPDFPPFPVPRGRLE
jgi:hypothetical protein